MANAPYRVDIQVQIESKNAMPLRRVQQAVEWVLAEHNHAAGTSLSVVLMEDDAVQRMSQEFRGVDKPTDVLSFPADVPLGPTQTGRYLGDLILALPYIQRQAAAEQHGWQDEIVLAVVHGTLHLLGYDHDTADNQREMWSVQSRALAALNVPIAVPVFEFDEDDDGADSNEFGAKANDVPDSAHDQP